VKSAAVAESLPAKIKMTGIVQNPQPRPARNLLANMKCPESCLGAAGNLPVNQKDKRRSHWWHEVKDLWS
jgi:hypothetical protein